MKLKLETPGVKACGPYKAGVVYDIEDRAEIDRLINLKGFTVVEPHKISKPISERADKPPRGKTFSTISGSEGKA